MGTNEDITVNIRCGNADAVVAFEAALDLVAEAAEDLPWRDDLAEAVELLRFAYDSLAVTGAQ